MIFERFSIKRFVIEYFEISCYVRMLTQCALITQNLRTIRYIKSIIERGYNSLINKKKKSIIERVYNSLLTGVDPVLKILLTGVLWPITGNVSGTPTSDK